MRRINMNKIEQKKPPFNNRKFNKDNLLIHKYISITRKLSEMKKKTQLHGDIN